MVGRFATSLRFISRTISLGAVRPPAHQDRPDERAAGAQHLKASRAHEGLDPGDRVDKGLKRISRPSAPIILPPCVRPHIPAVVRKAKGVIPLGLLSRK